VKLTFRTAPPESEKERLVMFSHKRIIGATIAYAGVLAAFTLAGSRASADDARLTVTPAVQRTVDGDDHGATIQLVRHGWGGGYRGYGWGGGYRGYGWGGGYRGWGGYGYRPFYRSYYGIGYGYPAYGYGYGYPAYGYGYGYPAYGGVGVGIW
jgi:hypothetical protein